MSEQTEEVKKPQIRVLALADFGCITGFANVAHNIVSQILKDPDVDYFVDVVGINYYGMPTEWNYIFPRVRVFPASLLSNGDLFGRQGFMQLLSSGAYDIAWILQDTFNIEPIGEGMIKLRNEMIEHNVKPFKWIFYFPIDATPKENWIRKSAFLADIPVAYTEYGKRESIKVVPEIEHKLRVIPHGSDPALFFPVEDKEAVAKFKKHYFMDKVEDKFLVINVNRNQPRKDIARTMQIFRLFKNQCPDAILYLHMKENDVAYGINEVARNFDLARDKDYIIPENFNEHDGVSTQVMNMIYNCADLVMTTTFGEGWGLSMTEAMAAKRPVIAPDHTSLTEMLADGRGTLISAGRGISDWVVLQADNERLRPIVSVPEYVEAMVQLKRNPSKRAEMAEKAYKHLIDNWTWDKVGEYWRQAFKDVLAQPKQEKLGRNDPCFCGSGKKFKSCHGQ